MTLRRVTLLVLSLSTIVLVGVLYLVTRWFMISGFDQVERAEVAKNVQRVRDALHATIEDLDSKTADWSAWDDTAKFIEDPNEDYIRSNLGTESIQTLGVDAMLFIDLQGNIVDFRTRPDDSGHPCDFSELSQFVRETPRLWKHPSVRSGVSGPLALRSEIWILASRPILTSDKAGPARGALLFARRLSPGFAAELAERTHLDIRIFSNDAGEAPANGEAHEFDGSDDGLVVSALDEHGISGRVLMTDALGRRSVVVETQTPRTIYQQGLASMRFQLLSIIAACMCVGLAVHLALGRLVLSRIDRMSRAIAEIAMTNDLTRRVDEGNRDELGTLGRDINAMLESQLEATTQLRFQAEQLRIKGAELEAANAKAEAAVKSKDTFLASISHEIRTPMTAILGFADMLGEDQVTADDRRRYLGTIRSNGETLLALIGDILDLAKMEAGGMNVELAPLNPIEVVRDAYELMKPVVAKKPVVYQLTADDAVPASIRADSVRLKQVLVNLIGNAIKFTSSGYVHVRLRASTSASDGTKRLLIDVIDSGIGLTPDQIARLFKPFSQGDANTSRRYGGTGLGLAISKRLTTMMGGDISVVSELGKGTTFTVSFAVSTERHAEPVRAVPQEEPRAIRSEANLSGRILVAEDGPDNQRLIRHILQRAGFEVDIVEDGKAAVERALGDSESFVAYDLILMDMQMPVMDGYEAADALRRRGCKTPVVALTAHAGESARRKCLDAGCDDVASKPIVKDVFLATCRKWIERETRRRAA